MSQQVMLTRGQRFLPQVGYAMLAAGVLCNEWLLGRIASSDGSISDPEDLFLIRMFQGICLCWGTLNVTFGRRRLAARLNLSIFALCLVSPILCELAIRCGIAAGSPSVRRPGLFADPLADDDYWKLRHQWSPEANRPSRFSAALVPDELLGWAPARGTGVGGSGIDASRQRNGGHRGRAEDAGAGGHPILFFGDSFVEGNTEPADRIPQVLDMLIPERPVYNLGVSGYGVDQIFLNLQHSHQAWQQPLVVIGILTGDLDRCLLRFREHPKPYFVLRGDALSLEGVPVRLSNDAWVKQNPPAIRSYLWAFLQMRYRLHQPGPWRELTYKRAEKISLNRRLLAELVRYCRHAGWPFCVVLFYEPDELDYVGWRETFILAELRQLEASVVDTKPTLIDAAGRNHVEASSYYQADDHLNAVGNRIVAQAIAEYLADHNMLN